MNPTKFIKNLLGVACACLALAACTTEQSGTSSTGPSAASSGSGARLIVHRTASFGGGFLTLTLDGTQVANVSLGQTYDAPVSPGKHVLTAVHTPNISAQSRLRSRLRRKLARLIHSSLNGGMKT